MTKIEALLENLFKDHSVEMSLRRSFKSGNNADKFYCTIWSGIGEERNLVSGMCATWQEAVVEAVERKK